MPYFNYDSDIHIDADEFLKNCSYNEIMEVIQTLIKDGYLPKHVLNNLNQMSISEIEFETALSKLYGKWNRLTKEEEETIINISKRF